MSVQHSGSLPSGLLEHRQVVPRWHSPTVAALSGEQGGFLTNSVPRRIPARWAAELTHSLPGGDPHRAVEQEELAYLLGHAKSDAPMTPAIKRLRTNWQRATDSSSLASMFSPGGETRERDQKSVHQLRRALGEHPHQALLWTELARHFLILGEEAKATDAIQCGLRLGASSAYVTRSAARFFTHVKDQERALRVVRRHPNVRRDPRLLSAEVALSSLSGMPSLYAKVAASIVDDTRYRPRQIADLTAALATVELEHGKHKLARRLFEKTFHDPTENSLAQAQWATTRDAKIVIPGEAWKTPQPYEALALAARAEGKWDEVVDSAEQWLSAERFSLQPATLGSFASFSIAQNQRAERLATAGLQANPGNILLLNNRAVARALLGRPAEAFEDIREALRHGGKDSPHLIATMGMVAYRSGDFALGTTCYGTALANFVDARDKSTLGYAILMWLRERALAGDETVPSEYHKLKPSLVNLTKLGKEPEVQTMMELLDADLSKPNFAQMPMMPVPRDDLQSAFAQFTPDREVITVRDRLLEVL